MSSISEISTAVTGIGLVERVADLLGEAVVVDLGGGQEVQEARQLIEGEVVERREGLGQLGERHGDLAAGVEAAGEADAHLEIVVRHLLEQGHHPADHEDVAGFELGAVDPLRAQEGAVGRAEVFEQHGAAAHREHGVAAGDGGVGQEDVARRVGAENVATP